MKLFIGAEHIISPLGKTAEDNFACLLKNLSGIHLYRNTGVKKENIYLSKISGPRQGKYDLLLGNCINHIQSRISPELFASEKTILILSTTKGDLDKTLTGTIINSAKKLKDKFSLRHFPLVVSNGCASGVIAINTGADLIRANMFENAIIAGCDVISDFVLCGFQSLFAISNEPCRPFDKNRKGITLGEACAALVLSKNSSVFPDPPMEYIAGTSSNDANHISGPSRTGEGLSRTIKKNLELAGMDKKEIDFISAHGTATVFNDDMESIAFNRLGMGHIPMNSLKGYFGHTLGAAGVLETAVCLQMMRNDLLLKSFGFESQGTPEYMNVLTENKKTKINTVLKTTSGFGGCNASLILKKP